MKRLLKKGKSQSQAVVLGRYDGQLKTQIWKSRYYYLMLLPAIVYVILFSYAPMYGLQIAFKNYKISLGVAGSPWVGFKNFTDFFQSYYFVKLLKNTTPIVRNCWNIALVVKKMNTTRFHWITAVIRRDFSAPKAV